MTSPKPKNSIAATLRLIVFLWIGLFSFAFLPVDHALSAGVYSPSDLQGKWAGNSLASGISWWERSSITIDDKGVFNGSAMDSDGTPRTVSGAFIIDKSGIMSVANAPLLQCSMDAGKTFFVCTDIKPSTTVSEMIIFTKKAEFYSIEDLTGNWIVSDMATPSDRHWGYYHFTIETNGKFSAVLIHDDGHSTTMAGEFTIDNDGSVSMYSSDFQGSPGCCSLDSGKTIFVCTPPNQSGQHGNMSVFAKQPSNCSLSNLEGDWHISTLISAPSWWGRSPGKMPITIKNDGNFVLRLDTSEGLIETTSGYFNITQDGSISLSSYLLHPSYCSMDAGKTIFTCIGFNHNGGNESELMVFTRVSVPIDPVPIWFLLF